MVVGRSLSPVGEGRAIRQPNVVDTVYRFADMEKCWRSGSGGLYPYLWDRYDVIVLPPNSLPWRNGKPRLTFATPTIIAGDGP